MSVVEALTSWAQPGKPDQDGRRRERHLRPVESAPATGARVPFVAVLGAVLVAGLLGLLVLNTAIQSQAKQLNALQNEATALGYQQGELTTQVQQLRSASTLEQKAYALGLRPNPHPAFITLADGKIVGTPTPVTGKEMPDQKWSSWQQQQAAQEEARAQVAAEAKRKADELKKRQAEQKAAAEKKAAEKKKADEKAAADKKAAQQKQAAQKNKASASPKPTATTGNR